MFAKFKQGSKDLAMIYNSKNSLLPEVHTVIVCLPDRTVKLLDYQDHHVICLHTLVCFYHMFFCLHISVLSVSLRCEYLHIFKLIIITLLTFM